MGFDFKEPARLYEPLNGHEIKKMILKELEKALEGDGNLRQNVTYPIFGLKYRFEYYTGGAGTFENKDWKSEGGASWAQKDLDIGTIEPEDVNKRVATGEIRVDGISVPADAVREKLGLAVPIPVATATGYVQTTMEQMRPRPTRTAQQEIDDLLKEVKAEEVKVGAGPTSPNNPAVAAANKLSGTGVKKSMSPAERAAKLRELQEG